MPTHRQAIGLVLAILSSAWSAHAQMTSASWLDRGDAAWNVRGAAVPSAPRATEAAAAILKRCQMPDRRGTAAERAIASAGWTPFLVFDRELAADDIEIIGGLAGADGMCRPLAFNVFVFVGGRFAGTLAPAPMNSRTDGAIGAVRILDGNSISAEFSRYTDRDALCCPSSRVSVAYRVERAATGPLATPMGARSIR
jgi:hypothetical protein